MFLTFSMLGMGGYLSFLYYFYSVSRVLGISGVGWKGVKSFSVMISVMISVISFFIAEKSSFPWC